MGKTWIRRDKLPADVPFAIEQQNDDTVVVVDRDLSRAERRALWDIVRRRRRQRGIAVAPVALATGLSGLEHTVRAHPFAVTGVVGAATAAVVFGIAGPPPLAEEPIAESPPSAGAPGPGRQPPRTTPTPDTSRTGTETPRSPQAPSRRTQRDATEPVTGDRGGARPAPDGTPPTGTSPPGGDGGGQAPDVGDGDPPVGTTPPADAAPDVGRDCLVRVRVDQVVDVCVDVPVLGGTSRAHDTANGRVETSGTERGNGSSDPAGNRSSQVGETP